MSQAVTKRTVLFLNPADNIGVCLKDFTPGEVINQDNQIIKVLNDIPRGHKIATKPIGKNEGVIKYGERMGHATTDIQIGEHVHTHNVLGDRVSTESKN
jgi:altronate hydrolase